MLKQACGLFTAPLLDSHKVWGEANNLHISLTLRCPCCWPWTTFWVVLLRQIAFWVSAPSPNSYSETLLFFSQNNRFLGPCVNSLTASLSCRLLDHRRVLDPGCTNWMFSLEFAAGTWRHCSVFCWFHELNFVGAKLWGDHPLPCV